MTSTATSDFVIEPMRYWVSLSGIEPSTNPRAPDQTSSLSRTTPANSDGARPWASAVAMRDSSADSGVGSMRAILKRKSACGAHRCRLPHPETELHSDVATGAASNLLVKHGDRLPAGDLVRFARPRSDVGSGRAHQPPGAFLLQDVRAPAAGPGAGE